MMMQMPFAMQRNNQNKVCNGSMVGTMVKNMNMSSSVDKMGQSGLPINMYPTYYNNSKFVLN